jgi:hypothetical protein
LPDCATIASFSERISARATRRIAVRTGSIRRVVGLLKKKDDRGRAEEDKSGIRGAERHDGDMGNHACVIKLNLRQTKMRDWAQHWNANPVLTLMENGRTGAPGLNERGPAQLGTDCPTPCGGLGCVIPRGDAGQLPGSRSRGPQGSLSR